MQEAATGGVLWKRVFFKILQYWQETHVPEETSVNFAKFLRRPFLQKNSERLLLKYVHCKNESREIDCLCCREVDATLIALAKAPERKRSISPSSFYEHLPNHRWVLLFAPSLAEGNKKNWANLRFYLFVSGVIQVEWERGWV